MSCNYTSHDDTPRCPGHFFECGEELSWKEDLCDSCKAEQNRQAHLEDLAVEAYERRQIEMDQYQAERAYDDDDELLCDACEVLIESGSRCGPCRRFDLTDDTDD